MALTPISKLARISPLSGNSVFPIVQNGTTYGAEISSVNNLNNLQTVTDNGNVTTNEIFVNSLSAQNSVITNDIIGSESNDSLQLKSDPEAPDGTNGGAQIELYSQDFTLAQSQIYHKARFHTFQDLLGNNTVVIDSDNGNVIIPNIATSPTGLSSGTIYSDGGTLKIVS